ncbi:MAG: 4a-hydroxytetrahydrobiopterin dehydratase [Verrucomicrobia bacterium]|nr:4a-hydroxytetrahydrobiopterin dehydratase [Verrucomicrobiota bacterium]
MARSVISSGYSIRKPGSKLQDFGRPGNPAVKTRCSVGSVSRGPLRSQSARYIDIRWNKVKLTLTTHDQGGLTKKDFALAAQFDAAAGRS